MKQTDIKIRWLRMAGVSLCLTAAMVIYVLLISNGVGFACPIYELTGMQCPGCGNSRAALCLLQGNFRGSYLYNPMFIPQICYIGWVYICCCVKYLKEKRFTYVSSAPGMDMGLLALFVMWGILRNFLPW